MILADLFTPTNEMVAIGALVVTVAGLAHGLNEILRLVDRFGKKGHVGEQFDGLRDWCEENFATKEEIKHAKELFAQTIVNQDTRITGIRDEVDQLATLIRENEDRHEARAVALHDRINPLLEALGYLKGKSKSHSQVLASIREGRPA